MEPRLVVARVTLGMLGEKCMSLEGSRENNLSRNNSGTPLTWWACDPAHTLREKNYILILY